MASLTDESSQIARPGKPQIMPSTLPTSVEATVLVNPNLQVYSEELKARVQDERHLHLRLTRLKLKKQGKVDIFEQSSQQL